MLAQAEMGAGFVCRHVSGSDTPPVWSPQGWRLSSLPCVTCGPKLGVG